MLISYNLIKFWVTNLKQHDLHKSVGKPQDVGMYSDMLEFWKHILNGFLKYTFVHG